ncbi:Uma2 family endonuclease [Aetokthonos hydrillicola Thurmond2011]|uniref:Uma2 family endonuclease n=1 Tax=Aetokthonos hydrillicola Thurmond2011 TaxID=2712845 RepID=A0AAP5I5Z7_9CYAN|nr:Uma2 family endonuclease [Aetokthonos hydrillicola]MBO3461743.1 Uma2 family endonuclease [Aetokthonos hydrillicola CCALA 1050]MBW4583876.1 Uma2 family endonuclease [Aetokthonos hydrillicola CCALA 1050]MDR9895426.1 Uma2 family endonuclease [Aetokthonos hydrillicola Thurmond2011]
MVFAQTSPPDAVTTRLTLDEYRAMEQTNPERHEYRNGEIITMSGGSEVHSAIASNLLIYLGFLLRDTDFRLYNSDLRVWIPEYQCGTYTDLMVVNGKPEFNENRNDEILNPLLIVEVLSPSTEAYDRGEKFRKYRSIASFCEYLLVSQTEPYIEQYYIQEPNSNDRWLLQVHSKLERAVILQSLNVEIPLAEIYRRVNF